MDSVTVTKLLTFATLGEKQAPRPGLGGAQVHIASDFRVL